MTLTSPTYMSVEREQLQVAFALAHKLACNETLTLEIRRQAKDCATAIWKSCGEQKPMPRTLPEGYPGTNPAPSTRPAPVDQHKDTAEDFGVWTLPATIGACRRAMEAHFQPAHYDAVERAVKHIGGHEITSTDVQNVIRAIETHEAAICEECGLFHAPPACTPQEAPADAEL